jgi:hypothetical protein
MKRFVKILLFLILFYLAISCWGCFGDPVFTPEKVEALPNTFKPVRNPLSFLHFKASEDKILWITVEDRTKRVWEIKATRDIPVSDFKVTVGNVPEGFEQLIPKPPEKFVPVPGEKYAIHIHTKFMDDSGPRTAFIMPTFWIAEPSNGK